MKACEMCGEATWSHMELCDDCLRKEATLENALRWGDADKKCVEINGFLAWLLSTAEIESILKDALTELDRRHAEAYCMDDPSAFDEFLRGEEE